MNSVHLAQQDVKYHRTHHFHENHIIEANILNYFFSQGRPGQHGQEEGRSRPGLGLLERARTHLRRVQQDRGGPTCRCVSSSH